ncbi:hypothetical protein XarjCFBP7652_12865 [Xanthomonas arboricola]|nr:hypothetical protein XarjCFBP7652_12865 [Xanthomonas arboricola]
MANLTAWKKAVPALLSIGCSNRGDGKQKMAMNQLLRRDRRQRFADALATSVGSCPAHGPLQTARHCLP